MKSLEDHKIGTIANSKEHPGTDKDHGPLAKQEIFAKEFADFLHSQPKAAVEFVGYLKHHVEPNAKSGDSDPKTSQASAKQHENLSETLDNMIDQALTKQKGEGETFNTQIDNIINSLHDQGSTLDNTKFKV